MNARFCDERGPRGFSWIVGEPMTRTSHVLAVGGRTWFVDPVAWEEAVRRAAGLGAPAAVVQLLDRHGRDCATLARRLDVPHLVAPEALPGTPFRVVDVVRRKRWQEAALWWEEARTLVVAEALGTNRFFTVAGDPVGVHGLLKAFPPKRLEAFEPEHLLVGHGEGLHGPATAAAVKVALGRSRARALEWAVKLPFALRASGSEPRPNEP